VTLMTMAEKLLPPPPAARMARDKGEAAFGRVVRRDLRDRAGSVARGHCRPRRHDS